VAAVRVPAGAREDSVRIQARARGIDQLPHACRAERRKLHADDTRQAGKLAKHHGQRMVTAHLLGAERGQDQQPGPGRRDVFARTAADRGPGGALCQGRRKRPLADAGLSAEEDEPVGAGKRLAGQSLQRGQEPSALD
jgi:hypothetical protein